jgi:hypothetical protein
VVGSTEFPGIIEEVLEAVFLFAEGAFLFQFVDLVVVLFEDDEALRHCILTGRLAKK